MEVRENKCQISQELCLPACRRLLFPLLHAENKGNRRRLHAGKNCAYIGKILKISCVRCNFVKFGIHFSGSHKKFFFGVTTNDLLHL